MNVNAIRDILKYENTYEDIQFLISQIEDDLRRGVLVRYKNINVMIEIPGFIGSAHKDALFRYFLDRGILASISEKGENTDIYLYDLSEHFTYKMGQKIISECVYFNKKRDAI